MLHIDNLSFVLLNSLYSVVLGLTPPCLFLNIYYSFKTTVILVGNLWVENYHRISVVDWTVLCIEGKCVVEIIFFLKIVTKCFSRSLLKSLVTF